MKINSEYKLREVAGESIVVQQGKAGADLTRIISLNSSARYLYQVFEGKDFSVQDVADALVEHYGIAQELASTDAARWAEELQKCGVILK